MVLMYTLHTRGVASSNLPFATLKPLIFKGFFIFSLSTSKCNPIIGNSILVNKRMFKQDVCLIFSHSVITIVRKRGTSIRVAYCLTDFIDINSTVNQSRYISLSNLMKTLFHNIAFPAIFSYAVLYCTRCHPFPFIQKQKSIIIPSIYLV